MSRNTLTKVVTGAVLLSVLSTPMLSSAQMLEEVVVTAQRRTQSLQEVPISIESFSGGELQEQGYRSLDDLALFSASVLVDDEGFLSTERTVRGFGTSGNALTLEQAVPIFIDGIHFGRPSQVKTAFMDLERVEVLKGPQPVFFGMSATAGAFNIQSARPTDEYEGYIDTEFGNNRKGVVEGAFGGPITDTVGFRVAGKYESSDGFMHDIVSGHKVGDYEQLGGRAMLEWKPTDNFTARLKIEGSGLKRNSEAVHTCLTAGSLIFGRDDPTRDSDEGNERSIYADPPQGSGWDQEVNIDANCFGSDNAVTGSGPFYAPPINIHEENSNTGAIDAREAGAAFNRLLWERTNGAAGSPYGLQGIEKIDSFNGYLDLAYTLDNGIEINSTTGYSGFKRLNVRDNSFSQFFMNGQNRVEIYDQWSQELRFTSAPGGTIEWMGGLFWQKTDYDITSNSMRPNVRRGLRYNDIIWEDQEWKTAFASVTFNFLDDRASIDLGGRYVDLNKTGSIYGVAAQWVFDVAPCDYDRDLDWQGLGDFDPATCALHPDAMQITEADTEFLLPDADVTNLWTLPYGESRDTPSSWRGSRAQAMGYTKLTREGRNEPFTPERGGTFSSSEFDPQITLRYRLSDNHSLFARWAQAFKAGGFDTGVTSINRTEEDFRFESENSETYEIGSKGRLLDGRARYDIALFRTTFNDFQITVPTGDPDDPFLNANAGQQRVQGAEFSVTAAITEQWTASLAGAFLDGKMTNFPAGGCTEQEVQNIPNSGCEIIDGDGVIDRTGQESPKTPDWKFVLTLDYWMPLFDDYKAAFNAKGYMSDGYITDINGFSKTVKYNKHEDVNLSVGVGDMDDVWKVTLWGRNLLGARPSYNAEFDVIPNGILQTSMSPNSFSSYGVKFRYNFR